MTRENLYSKINEMTFTTSDFPFFFGSSPKYVYLALGRLRFYTKLHSKLDQKHGRSPEIDEPDPFYTFLYLSDEDIFS